MKPGKGVDPFGIDWVVTSAGAMPDTRVPPKFTEIEEWRDYVHFPNLDDVDFKGTAEVEMNGIDRSEKLVFYYSACGVFERLAAYMGFADALVAIAENPDECRAFYEAFTDYKIAVAERIVDAYDIDVYYNFDDVATAKGLFISPDTYREVIKPCHARLAKAITDMGVIFGEHTCGKCEEIVPDYVDFGAKIWTSAQIMNDISGLQERFKGQLVIEGCWNSSGRPGFIDATEEEVRAETRRCLSEYGSKGGYILRPVIFNERGNSVIVGDDRLKAVADEWMKYRDLEKLKAGILA
ncbi:MAG: uroporphyrinogen decarboxylase family protein [Coriobacteriales bacterium]